MSTRHALGRHVEHDNRSWQFGFAGAATLRTVQHQHHGPVLDQGQLGACTANAISQALNTGPLYEARQTRPNHVTGAVSGRLLTEDDAVSVYEAATRIDSVPGQYPPDDTGSSGLAVAKVVRARGLIGSYRHAFSWRSTLAALVVQPVIIGIPWYEQMFTPAADGTLTIGGSVAGGHEVCLTGLDVEAQTVTVLNSWGNSWGLDGTALLHWDDLDQLLQDHGDCTVPVIS